MATRYHSYESRSSSTTSSLTSSAEITIKPPTASSRTAIVKTHRTDQTNFTSMVKKFMEKNHNSSSSSSSTTHFKNNKVGLVIPADIIAEDLKRTARKGTAFSGLQKKLFGDIGKKKHKSVKGEEVRPLTEVKGANSANTRTLGMVLRSERELLGANKELEAEVEKLKSLLEDKNREVEKLKDLCLKQREEIKALKSAVLFPEDEVNSRLQDMLERQGKELKQAKQLIPTLQKQVTSLTDQLQGLADDLAEVKADKFAQACVPRGISSPRTRTYDHEQAANSLEFSYCEPASPGSPDDMFLKDLNPCLTPLDSKTKSKEFEEMDNDSPREERLSKKGIKGDFGFNSRFKMSKSSDNYQSSNIGTTVKAARRSEDSKRKCGKQTHQRFH